jgi:hypothetical protein
MADKTGKSQPLSRNPPTTDGRRALLTKHKLKFTVGCKRDGLQCGEKNEGRGGKLARFESRHLSKAKEYRNGIVRTVLYHTEDKEVTNKLFKKQLSIFL